VPGIHAFSCGPKDVDHRHKAGDDDLCESVRVGSATGFAQPDSTGSIPAMTRAEAERGPENEIAS